MSGAPQKQKAQRKHTPMMAQYLGIKAEHPDAILLFRMGDFYETFYDDAKLVASVLGITLTSREKKDEEPIPLAGVPFHALDHYLGKLLDHGCTVAICEQMEDPKQAKGIVRREVVEILSPGTVTHPDLLSDDESRWLLSLKPQSDDSVGYALLDGSTGEFRCGLTPIEEIAGILRRHRVGEVVLPEGQKLDARASAALVDLPLQELSPLLFADEFAEKTLCEHFRTTTLDGLGVGDMPAAVEAAGAALRYLADRQRRRPSQVHRLRVDRPEGVLHLDRETIAHLELFAPLRPGDRRACLVSQLDQTRTPMGRRRLAQWLRRPLAEVAPIEARLDAVNWLVDDATRRTAAREALRGMGDLERTAGRIATERAMPNELASLRAGLRRLEPLLEALREANFAAARQLRRQAQPMDSWLQRLDAAIVDEPPAHLRNGGVFRDRADARLDELRELARGGKQWIAAYQQQERERTGISSLKIGFNKVFGYHVEVTNPHLSKVPDDYDEKQKLATGKRFITDALKEREQQILQAQEQLIARESELFDALRAEFAAKVEELQRVVDEVADVDVLCGFAEIAARRRYVRPTLDDTTKLEIRGGRHPVVEQLVDEPFVPNDLQLDAHGERQLVLLTGPNMGGKSTYLRQAALFVILAQVGCFVPAESAHVGLVDRVYTRVGASDDLARGQSTFLVEMSETANILRNATSRTLVILDEVGRGTSTDDGLALAWAITEHLHDGPAHPKTLFATHFHELTELGETLPRATNLQMQVKEWEGEILFLHSVIGGPADRSYGIHVARLAGVPEEVLRRARQLLAQPPGKGSGNARTPAEEGQPQLDLFSGPERQVLSKLKDTDPDRMRPLEALQLLDELKRALESDRDS